MVYPGQDDASVAENFAEYFNAISSEYEPLNNEDVPTSFDRPLPLLSASDVEKRIQSVKKPNSRVPGDLEPPLYADYGGALSTPIADVFNSISTNLCWPDQWTIEYVTIIPKSLAPQVIAVI